MTGAEFVQRPEHLRVQPGHQTQDPGLHMIHVRQAAEPDAVVLDRVLGELRERPLHLRAVVRLTLIPGDPDPGALDVDAVPYLV